MGGNDPGPNRPDGAPSSDGRPLADEAGASLFELTERPAVEYTSTDETIVVQRVNAAFDETFGVDGDHDLASLLSAVVVADGDHKSAIVEEVTRGTDERVTRQCRTASGVEPFHIRTVPADGGGFLVFETAVADDVVTALEYLTHSLRNPLEVAIIHTEVASETDSMDYLETVQSAHDRMGAIITDAAHLARQGAFVADTEPVDVASVAVDAWETVHTDGATIDIDSPGIVDADERGLRVLFENLFRNSAEHGATGPVAQSRRDGLDHATAGARSRTAADGDSLTVTVSSIPDGFAVADDGQGIPEVEREQVLDVGYTTAEDGTGLGLAIVADVAESHGWTVGVAESAGGGTRFEFTGVARPNR